MVDLKEKNYTQIRASKSWRRADARLRKIIKNLRKMCTFELKIGKTGISKNELAQFDNLLLI